MSRTLVVRLVVVSVALLLPHSVQAAGPVSLVMLDGAAGGRAFDGVGAISGGGGNTRLLIDYPSRERSGILDALFKPRVGASLQILKVEIGGDTNSTDGAESSIGPTRGRVDCNTGYEWWLMEQARARNPAIKLYGLAWGAPGWVGEGRQTFFTPSAIGYLVSWLGCARLHRLAIDYLGGWNERGYDIEWYKQLRSSLDAAGYGSVQVVAADDSWGIVDGIGSDATLAGVVDVIGVHYPCSGGNGGDALSCRSPPNASLTGKRLWASENGSRPYIAGAAVMARALNRGYVDGAMTAYLNWPLVAALYPNLPYASVGLIVANQPWSGRYSIGSQLWVTAHWTQFSEPGWNFIDSASGWLGGDERYGTYVTLREPGGIDYSTIIETTTATETQTIRLVVTGGLSPSTVHVWATNLSSSDPSRWFTHVRDLTPINGSYSLRLQPNFIYTLTTTTGQTKGAATDPRDALMALPYADGFETASLGSAARYLANMQGDFQVQPCTGNRSGKCVQQMATTTPVEWRATAATPFAVLGDTRWSSYSVGVDTLFEQPGAMLVLGRIGAQNRRLPQRMNGYSLRVASSGKWMLERTSRSRPATTLVRGAVTPLGLRRWHRLGLTFDGSLITASIDGRPVASTRDTAYKRGQIGLGISSYHASQFDNLSITPRTGSPSTSRRHSSAPCQRERGAGNVAAGRRHPAAEAGAVPDALYAEAGVSMLPEIVPTYWPVARSVRPVVSTRPRASAKRPVPPVMTPGSS